jgi:APA family basic amino acid/polyamine antiporter
MRLQGKIGWKSATAVVVANMVGTGAFTTMGIQLNYLNSAWSILFLWLIGGLVALCGAFTYAEIGTRLPRSGGEAHFLTKIYHPFFGFLSGWVSLTVGFAASVALAAMAIGDYLGPVLNCSPRLLGVGSVVAISLVHSFTLKHSSRFQNILTVVKLLLVFGLILTGLILPARSAGIDWSAAGMTQALSPAAAVSLIFVFYAFSGWNAAAYIIDEIDAPQRNLPRALLVGTIGVSLLFVLLQYVFLRQAPVDLLRGEVEIGQIVAVGMFGSTGGLIVSGLIAVLLIASISAMIWVGPRVVRKMAENFPSWRFFAADNGSGIPVRAIWLQSGISLFLILTSYFERVMLYSGFVLQLFTFLTVAGLFLLRKRQGKFGWRSPFFPVAQLIFLAFSLWAMSYLLIDKPYESLLGLLNIVAGVIAYFWGKWRYRNAEVSESDPSPSAVPEEPGSEPDRFRRVEWSQSR